MLARIKLECSIKEMKPTKGCKFIGYGMNSAQKHVATLKYKFEFSIIRFLSIKKLIIVF